MKRIVYNFIDMCAACPPLRFIDRAGGAVSGIRLELGFFMLTQRTTQAIQVMLNQVEIL